MVKADCASGEFNVDRALTRALRTDGVDSDCRT